jgi:phthiocerol/phenolphthiocerol synthesis type-I polyketide synthase C
MIDDPCSSSQQDRTPWVLAPEPDEAGPTMKQIHITGMACRLPGANGIGALADLLYGNICAVTEIPRDRWNSDVLRHPKPGTKGKSYTFAAGVIDDVWDFDPDPFGIAPREAAQMDPQQRILLQVAYEAIEDAGLPFDELAGRNVGVYVGASALDYSARLSVDGMTVDAFTMTGNTLSLVSNRISHVFGFNGPSLTVDTACSSSLVALNEAEKAVKLGEIDIAIVGGVNLLLSPVPFIGFSAARMLSPTGLSRPFSAEADGYTRGEGAVAIVLQALPSKSVGRSYGRLVGVATNSDGRTTNVALPSAAGQGALMERLYAETGVDPAGLAFVEAHGTGTLVGDPIEAEALGKALGRHRTEPLPIGSIKSNIGHLEPASGLAGLLKLLLALDRGQLPASLHATDLNEAIDFEGLNLTLARQNLPLGLDDKVRFAGISSFGFGGTNVHAIIEKSTAQAGSSASQASKPRAGGSTLLISAAGAESLRGLAADYRAQAASIGNAGLASWCDHAVHFRGQHQERLAVHGKSMAEIEDGLDKFLAGARDPRIVQARSRHHDAPVVFVYSGNGSQYPGMSLAALEADSAYAETYHEIDRRFLDLSGISLIRTLQDPTLNDLLNKTEYAQPLLFADQAALTRALMTRGLEPAATLGHSAGEVAAAFGAGALDLDQAVRMIHCRCQGQMQLEGLGTMAALQASVETAEAILASGAYTDVSIAAVNSPRSVTMVGPKESVGQFIRDARRTHRLAAVPLTINYPYHSAMQDRIEDQLRSDLTFLNPVDGVRPFYSTVAGDVVPGRALDVDYWWSMARQPVQFAKAIQAAAGSGYRAFLEIGAQPVLTGYIKDCLQEPAPNSAVVSSLQKSDTTEVNPVARAFNQAVVAGCRIDRTLSWPRPRAVQTRLPTYHWNAREFRQDLTQAINVYYGVEDNHHPLLGLKIDRVTDEWKSTIDLDVLREFSGHVIGRNVLAPGTYFVEMALAAAQRVLDTDRITIRDLDIVAPLTLTAGNLVQVRTLASRKTSGVQVFSVPPSESGPRQVHATCRFGPAPTPGPVDHAPVSERQDGDRDGWILYQAAAEVGLDYGPGFRRVSHFRQGNPETWEVVLRPVGNATWATGDLTIDPIGVDAVFHGVVAALMAQAQGRQAMGYVPVHVGRITLHNPGVDVATGRIVIRKVGQRSILADIACYGRDGALAVQLDGVRFRAVRLLQDVDLETAAITLEPTPMTGPSPGVLSDAWQEVADAVALDPRRMPQDDTPLLIEAATHRILYDAMQAVRPEEALTPLCRHAFKTLQHAGLVLHDTDRPVLVEECPLPDAGDLLDALLDDHRALVPEVAVLSRLREVLPDRLTAKEPIDLVECFGREALENLLEGSIYEGRRRSWFAEALQTVLDRNARGIRIRIAEVVGGKAPIMPDVLRGIDGRSVDLVQVNIDSKGEYVARTSRAIWNAGPCETIESSKDARGSAAPFDLIVINGNLHLAGGIDQLLSDLSDRLTPGGAILSVNQGLSDFLDTVVRVADADEGDVSAPLDPVRLARSFEAAGLIPSEAVTLPDGFGSAYWMIARKPDQTLEATVSASDALQHAIQSALEGLGGDDCAGTTGISSSSAVDGGGTGLDIVVLHPPSERHDPVAHLTGRIEVLARRLHAVGPTPTPIWVLLPSGLADAQSDPEQSAIQAFLRSARNEYPAQRIHCVCISVQTPVADAVRMLAEVIWRGTEETELVLDRDGLVCMRARLGLPPEGREDGRDEAVLTLGLPDNGRLKDVSWRTAPRRDLGRHEVRIKVAAAGLNYRDVMWALGILPEEALENGFAGSTLGIECAGVITATGADVADMSVGDTVMTFGPNCLASEVTIDRKWVHPLPADTDLRAAATIPVAFFTAFFALHHLGRLEAGETVLIHGGAGGVGLAAIQVARWRGATIIATAGSPTKRAFLRQLGVDHVPDSRSLDFALNIRRLTGGRGVDVVLNSLAGEAMELSLQAMAPFGRFLELGKQDFYLNTEIGLRPLKENIAYFGVDVDQVLATKPDLAARVFGEMLERFEAGDFTPLPYRLFNGEDVVDAFRLMQRSGHIGKIVVDPSDLRSDQRLDAGFAAAPDGAHVIVGGLGGLGFRTADWLIRKGAHHLVLVGRSARPDTANQHRIDRMRGLGIRVDLVACDVSDRGQVATLIQELRDQTRIAGLIHAAMDLDDATMDDLTEARIRRTISAKVAGAANLDAETRSDALDYFVVVSSIAALIGNHGQSAYAAANAYMEGLVRQRRNQGLPGLALGLGPISDAGYLTRDAAKAGLMRRMSGGAEFSARQALAALDRLLSRPPAQPVVHVSPMNWQNVTALLPTMREPMLASLRRLGELAGSAPQADDLRDALLAMLPKDAEQHLTRYLVQQIVQILHIPEAALPVDQPISELGMDSLMGVELGLSVQEALGSDISMAAIAGDQTIKGIAQTIVAHVQSGQQGGITGDRIRDNLAAQHLTGEAVAITGVGQVK